MIAQLDPGAPVAILTFGFITVAWLGITTLVVKWLMGTWMGRSIRIPPSVYVILIGTAVLFLGAASLTLPFVEEREEYEEVKYSIVGKKDVTDQIGQRAVLIVVEGGYLEGKGDPDAYGERIYYRNSSEYDVVFVAFESKDGSEAWDAGYFSTEESYFSTSSEIISKLESTTIMENAD